MAVFLLYKGTIKNLARYFFYQHYLSTSYKHSETSTPKGTFSQNYFTKSIIRICKYNNVFFMDECRKYLSRYDCRVKFTEEQTRKLFLEVRKKNTAEEIENELRKIYDSSLGDLELEDRAGILIFDSTL
jgi:hypothetical protein